MPKLPTRLLSSLADDLTVALKLALGGEVIRMRAAGDGGAVAVEIGEGGVIVIFEFHAILFQMEIGDIHRNTARHDASVRLNGDGCGSGREIDIKIGSCAVADAVKEIADDEIVAAAVAGLLDLVGIGVVPLGHIVVGLFHPLGNIPIIVAEHDLAAASANVFDLSLGAANAIGIAVRTPCGTSGYAEYGIIVVKTGDNGGTVALTGAGRHEYGQAGQYESALRRCFFCKAVHSRVPWQRPSR